MANAAPKREFKPAPKITKRKLNSSDAATTKTKMQAKASSSQFEIPQFTIEKLQLDGPGESFPVGAEESQNRSQLLETINLCLSKQNSESTINSYEAIIKQEVGGIQVAFDIFLLPLDSEDKFLALFGWMYSINSEIKWSRIRSLKSVLIEHHVRRGESPS